MSGVVSSAAPYSGELPQCHTQVQQPSGPIANPVPHRRSRLRRLLSTIPPLGLGASDPREAIREQVNADIKARPHDFNADGYIDFNSTVVSSTAPNQINSAYLTNNSPNAGYYQALADAVINAVNNAPPTGKL